MKSAKPMDGAPSTTAPEVTPPWTGEPGTVGRVAVVGAGKIGLPLAAQYASAGWTVVACDVNPAVVESINAGRSHVVEEAGLAQKVAEAHAAGRLSATLDTTAAVRDADVVVVIVPVMLSEEQTPDYRFIDPATAAIAAGLRSPADRGAPTLVIYETTLPVADTRLRFGPMLAAASGLPVGDSERGFLLAFSPERVFSGRILRDLATYPKLVGGVNAVSAARAAAFYRSALTAEVWELSSAEAAEFAKLAETTYRDVNIALANEFARYADRLGVDIREVIRGANSQPFSHVHQPGIGVGGHCIPVYPYFLISRGSEFALAELARRINDGQVGLAVAALEHELGDLEDVPVLVLGLTYREEVHELAYSSAIPLIERLRFHGAEVWGHDPLLSAGEIERLGARPYRWGDPSEARAIVVQTGAAIYREMDLGPFPRLAVLFDGRNALRELPRPPGVRYVGVGVQEPGSRAGGGRRAAAAGRHTGR